MMMVLSEEPDTIWSPGLHATLLTSLVCPLSFKTCIPVPASQTIMSLSSPAEAIVSFVWFHATQFTGPACPRSVAITASNSAECPPSI